MRELPILFSAPMVRAILEGRKTVTRRVVKPSPGLQRTWLTHKGISNSPSLTMCYTNPDRIFGAQMEHPGGGPLGFVKCPYGEPGDRLYVRETTEIDEDTSAAVGLTRYAADKAPVLVTGASDPAFNGTVEHWDYPRRSRPGIHLPKAQSRIWLEVTAVRVERLQDITAEQAIAEGAIDRVRSNGTRVDMREQFSDLWDGLANPGTRWADNPWVWVVEFRRVNHVPEQIPAEYRGSAISGAEELRHG